MPARSEADAELKRQRKLIPDHLEIITKLHEFEAKCRKGDPDPATIRAIVLISTGLLEYSLEVAISSFLSLDQKLKQSIFGGDGGQGIIGSFYARIIMARALNIYGDETLNEIHNVRKIRNLCAHAKHDTDLSADALTALGQFHSITKVNAALGTSHIPGFGVPISPVQGMLMFLVHIVPYLLLHSSSDWSSKNRSDWRGIFS